MKKAEVIKMVRDIACAATRRADATDSKKESKEIIAAAVLQIRPLGKNRSYILNAAAELLGCSDAWEREAPVHGIEVLFQAISREDD